MEQVETLVRVLVISHWEEQEIKDVANPESGLFAAYRGANVVVVKEGGFETQTRVIKGHLGPGDIARLERIFMEQSGDTTATAKTKTDSDRNDDSVISPSGEVAGERGRGADGRLEARAAREQARRDEARSFEEPAMERGLRRAENDTDAFEEWLKAKLPGAMRTPILEAVGLMSQRRFSELSFDDRMGAGRLLAQYGAEPVHWLDAPMLSDNDMVRGAARVLIGDAQPMPTVAEVHEMILLATNEDMVGEVTESSIADRVHEFIAHRWPKKPGERPMTKKEMHARTPEQKRDRVNTVADPPSTVPVNIDVITYMVQTGEISAQQALRLCGEDKGWELPRKSTAWEKKPGRTSAEVFIDTLRALTHWRNGKIGRSYNFEQRSVDSPAVWRITLFYANGRGRSAQGDVLAYVMDSLFTEVDGQDD